jgi:hypothetical protein
MTETNLSALTVVLVHAAWADASSWNKIIPPLQHKGMRVVAVQIPLTSLSDDVVTVGRTLQRVSVGRSLLCGCSHYRGCYGQFTSEGAHICRCDCPG